MQLLKALCHGFLAPMQAIGLLRQARAHHEERRRWYEVLVRSTEAGMRSADRHAAAAALGRQLTARRGAGTQESYVAWCDEAIAALEAFAAGNQRQEAHERGR